MDKQYHAYSSNHIRWVIKCALSDTLKELLESVSKEKNCKIVRDSKNRRVLTFTNNYETFYIKHYTVRHWKKVIKSLISQRAKREWLNAHRLLNNYVLTAEPVAIGRKRGCGLRKDDYLILKAVPNCISARDLITGIQQSSQDYKRLNKNSILMNIISCIRKMHDQGILHGDLHAGNILINTHDTSLVYLIDLDLSKYKSTLPLSWRIRDLSRLLYSIMDVCSVEEIKTLIRSYADFLSPLSSGSSKNFSHSLSLGRDMHTCISHRKIFNEIYRFEISRQLRLSKIMISAKNNTSFKVFMHGNYTKNMLREWDIYALQTLIDKHDTYFQKILSHVTRSPSRTNITRIPVTNKDAKSMYIKEYIYSSFWEQFLYYIFNSPAWKEWITIYNLMALDLRTYKPVALVEEKKFCRIKRSLIIMEDIPSCMSCDKYIKQRFIDQYDKTIYAKKRLFISRFGIFLRQLHDSKILYQNLNARNILILELQNTWDFCCVDVDQIHFKEMTLNQWVKNLAQLNVSISNCITSTDRIRLYRAYTGTQKLTREDKQIAQAILRASKQLGFK